jgi:hypothetical protein
MKVLDGMKYIGMASRFIRIKMVVFCGNKKRRREQKIERIVKREREINNKDKENDIIMSKNKEEYDRMKREEEKTSTVIRT